MSKGNFDRTEEHTRHSGFSRAIAYPSSNQTLGVSSEISTKQASESEMCFSMLSIRIEAAGSWSTRYGSNPADSIAGLKTCSYRLSYRPPSNFWTIKHFFFIKETERAAVLRRRCVRWCRCRFRRRSSCFFRRGRERACRCFRAGPARRPGRRSRRSRWS